MNQLLFDRSTGSLGPYGFAKIQITQLLHSIQATPKYRFDGGEKALTLNDDDKQLGDVDGGEPKTEIWAHQAGVNAVVVDHFDGRLCDLHSAVGQSILLMLILGCSPEVQILLSRSGILRILLLKQKFKY